MPKFNSISISGLSCRKQVQRQISVGLYLGRRFGISACRCCTPVSRHRCLRSPLVVLLGYRYESLHGIAKMRTARLLWAKLVETVQPENRNHWLCVLTHRLQDGHWPNKSVQQRRPYLYRSHGCRTGTHPVTAYQCIGWENIALPTTFLPVSLVTRRFIFRKKLTFARMSTHGRFLLCRVSDKWTGSQGLGTYSGNRKTGWYGGYRNQYSKCVSKKLPPHSGPYRLRWRDYRGNNKYRLERRPHRYPRSRQHRRSSGTDWELETSERTRNEEEVKKHWMPSPNVSRPKKAICWNWL